MNLISNDIVDLIVKVTPTIIVIFSMFRKILMFFFRNKNLFLTKYIKKLDNEILNNSSQKFFCIREKNIQFKMEITKIKNRELAQYLYDMSDKSNNIISPSQFYKLYPFIKINNGILQKDESQKIILWANNFYFCFISAILFLLGFGVLFYSMFIKTGDKTILISFFYCIVSLIACAFFSSKIITKKNWAVFNNSVNKFSLKNN